MTTLSEYYGRAFSSELFFGLRMVINIGSMLVMLWMFALAYLVWRADSKSLQNRFIATLLLVEGFKCLWIALEVFPYTHEWNAFWVVAWNIKFDFFFAMQIAAIFLYLCFPIYYKIRGLGFMHRPSLQTHAYYLPLIAGIGLWALIQGQPAFAVNDLSWIECTAEGAAPVVHEFLGTSTSAVVTSGIETTFPDGVCPAALDASLGDEPFGIWAIVFAQTPISILALLFIRSSIKKNAGDEVGAIRNQISNSFYIGFLGKVLGSVLFFVMLLLVLPLLNGGIVPNFQDEILWRYSDPTFMARFKYFLFILVFAFGPIGLAFEAMMFVHASLNDSVFGIDQDLRRTFRNALFTGSGAFLFILTSEIMENMLGFGLAGGVIVGLGFLGVRRPVLSLIDGFSGRLIPTTYSFEETQYLKAYSDVIIDGEVSEKERTLLATLARAYGIDAQRVSDLEQGFAGDDSI
ncbi:MAG TPA: hypothetical protein HA353_02595 [Candidatus Poseidonia sp.]|nr:hypothetical protein [Poseidonia sp.]